MDQPVEVYKKFMNHPVEESLRIPDQVSLCQGVLKSKPIIQYTIDDVYYTPFIHSFIHSSFHPFIHSFIHSSFHPFTHSSFLPSYLPSFLSSFLPSLLPSFLPSSLPSSIDVLFFRLLIYSLIT